MRCGGEIVNRYQLIDDETQGKAGLGCLRNEVDGSYSSVLWLPRLWLLPLPQHSREYEYDRSTM